MDQKGFNLSDTLLLQSPKVDEGFETLQDKDVLESKLRKLLRKLKERTNADHDIDLECEGWNFAKMANNVFERMKDITAYEKFQDTGEEVHDELFRKYSWGIMESSPSENALGTPQNGIVKDWKWCAIQQVSR